MGAGGPPFLWQPGLYDQRVFDEAEYEAIINAMASAAALAGQAERREAWPWLFVALRQDAGHEQGP